MSSFQAARRRQSRISSRGQALVLAMRGQYAEAARLLLAELPIPLSAGTARDRREASVAARYLEKAGRHQAAERLCAILGTPRPQRATLAASAPAASAPAASSCAETRCVPAQDVDPESSKASRECTPRTREGRMPYRPGDYVARRFRVEAELGRGGMAVVYRATDLELEEPIAIKVFCRSASFLGDDREGLLRFRQELKLARRLTHPNIVRVHDIGVDSGRRYITMELLVGSSLNDLLGAPMVPALAVSILQQACAGLGAAHAAGIVHRDIKPENLFVTDQGTVKVMDFGIAKSARMRGPTQVGTIAGTPEYISPEQINGFSAVGPAADQYSLGVVAYEMLTGTLPFHHEQLLPLFFMHLETPAPSLREHVPDLPVPLDEVVLQMLAKDPAERHVGCQALAHIFAKLRATL